MDVEAMIQNEWGDFKTYHPFMDYNVGLWAPQFGLYIDAFNQDKIPFTALKWTSDDAKDYYSLIVNACGYVVLELFHDQVPPKYASLFNKTEEMRFSFKSRNNKPSQERGPKILTPMKVSRGTARMEEVKKYYTKAIGVDMLYNKTYADGTEHVIYMYE